MDDEMLTDILAQAILKSACAEAQCRVSAEVHKWWVYVVHLDDHAHTCPACKWVTEEGGLGYPRRFIPMSTILTGDRGLLVSSLSAWLSHLHVQPAAALDGGGGGRTPIDADAPTDTPGANGIVADSGAGDGLITDAGDRVASVPHD